MSDYPAIFQTPPLWSGLSSLPDGPEKTSLILRFSKSLDIVLCYIFHNPRLLGGTTPASYLSGAPFSTSALQPPHQPPTPNSGGASRCPQAIPPNLGDQGGAPLERPNPPGAPESPFRRLETNANRCILGLDIFREGPRFLSTGVTGRPLCGNAGPLRPRLIGQPEVRLLPTKPDAV
jgi:hypothetical protein